MGTAQKQIRFPLVAEDALEEKKTGSGGLERPQERVGAETAVSDSPVNEGSTIGHRIIRKRFEGSQKNTRMPVKKKPLVVVTRKLPDVNRDANARTVRRASQSRRPADDRRADRGGGGAPPTSWSPPSPTKSPRPFSTRASSKLKLIANFGNGIDNIDVAAAHKRGITVTNTPRVLTEDTADMTMALLLAVPRRLIEGAAILAAGANWPSGSPTWMLGRRIGGKRLGIIGMGRIGQAVARRAHAFGLQIHYHNRRPVAPQDRRGVERDLLGQPRPDAGAHGLHLGELSPHARRRSICCRRGGSS